jgi:hypothetical protein
LTAARSQRSVKRAAAGTELTVNSAEPIGERSDTWDSASGWAALDIEAASFGIVKDRGNDLDLDRIDIRLCN